MGFSVKENDSVVYKRVKLILEEGINPYVSCSFYDPLPEIISSEGCTFVGLSSTSITCGSNHSTYVMVLVKTQGSETSNYELISVSLSSIEAS